MKDAGKAIKPRILVVKHSLNRYTLPLPVEPGKAHIKYFVGYMEPLTEEALWKNGVDFERIGLLKMWKEIIQGKYDLVMTGIDYFPEFKGTFILCKLLGIPGAFLGDRGKWEERERRPGFERPAVNPMHEPVPGPGGRLLGYRAQASRVLCQPGR